jgi:hypothetical protein
MVLRKTGVVASRVDERSSVECGGRASAGERAAEPPPIAHLGLGHQLRFLSGPSPPPHPLYPAIPSK